MDIRSMATADDLIAANYIRESKHFNRDFYISAVRKAEANLDPALHYLLVGEQSGFDPSTTFSAKTYDKLNPDVAQSSTNRLLHYEAHGRHEGRSIAFLSDAIELETLRLDPGKPTVILFLHEATYSGAPILGWNLVRELRLTRNVIVVIRNGGALQAALASAATAIVGPIPPQILGNTVEMSHLAERLKVSYEPLYAIANSTETRDFAVALSQQGIAIVALVHEFATHAPAHALKPLYNSCDALVFPAEIVLRSSLEAYGLIAQRRTHVLPQGPSEVPRIASASSQPFTLGVGAEKLEAKPFTVLGMGAVDIRKGVDLFVAAATALKFRHPDLSFRFIWVGERVHPLPHTYYTFLDEQIKRSGLGEHFILVDAVDDLAPVYAEADAFFLSSRLDPLPNVGIDAALKGIPILCFEEATGFAELLGEDPLTSWLVAPHMDTGAVADKLAVLALDRDLAERVGVAIRRMGRARFNFMRYAANLDALGHAGAQRRLGFMNQVETLLPADAFDAELYFGADRSRSLPREEAVGRYLADNVNVDFSGPAVWGEHPRRALPGFNPLIYARLSAGFDKASNQDPLAHFVASGRPSGAWVHEVIRLDQSSAPQSSAVRSLRVGIHGHFHYTESFPDFLMAVESNDHPTDLIITTTGDEAASQLRDASLNFKNGSVTIEVVENAGRDIGPFVTVLEHILKNYDIVGHLHGKRSEHTFHYDAELGNRWRNFLWQHLVGPEVPVIDVVVDRFGRDDSLGMIFPENDFMVGWEQNREIAEGLASRFGLKSLPEHIEFPVGTMFWARPEALQGLITAKIVPSEYPLEPLPIDGTMLHAMERMLPLLVESAGYRYATTHFPLFTR